MKKLLIPFLFIAVCLLAGCFANPGSVGETASPRPPAQAAPVTSLPTTPTPTVPPGAAVPPTRVNFTATPIDTPTPSVTPSITPTSTLTPPLTFTKTPVWTAVPTLLPDQVLKAIRGYLSDNGGCELPCWWGITPGETTWEEARSKLSLLGLYSVTSRKNQVGLIEYEFKVPLSFDSLGYISPTLTIREGIVTSIGLNSRWVSRRLNYSLAGFLKKLGKPKEIWLSIFPESMDQPHYDISLFYSDKGVMVYAIGKARVQDNRFTICPQRLRIGEYPPALLLWKPSETIDFLNIDTDLLGNDDIWYPSSYQVPDGYQLLEELTDGFDEEDFYQTYLDPASTACFDVDLSKLP
jgi:hypothetical protein